MFKGVIKMITGLKILLILSLIFNIISLWAVYHYTLYGGSPLLEIKRMLTGSSKQTVADVPYKEQNSAIINKQSKEDYDSLSVVFVGASITMNWELEEYFTLIKPIKRVLGGFAPELLQNFQSNVLDLKPRAVVIKFCSINIRPQIPQNILRDCMKMMVQLAKSNNIIPIISTMIPSAKAAAHIGDYSVKDNLAEFNAWVRTYAEINDLVLIDYARAIQDEEGFLPRNCSIDPVHINGKGYDIIAEAALPVIYKKLGIEQ